MARPRPRSPKFVVPASAGSPRPRSKFVVPASAGSSSPRKASVPANGDAAEKSQLLQTLSEQIAELREMNVDILSRAAFIQAALDTLLTIHAGVDAGTRDLYASYFFSSRETIAAGMRHLGMQQALE